MNAIHHVGRPKLLKPWEARWRISCGRALGKPDQWCSGGLGEAFGVVGAYMGTWLSSWEQLDDRALVDRLCRWGERGTNLLHLATTGGFYEGNLSGLPPDRWVLTHPLGLRLLPDGSFEPLTKTRVAQNGHRIGRRPIPAVVRASDATFVNAMPGQNPSEAMEVARLRRATGGRQVIGHRAELPAVVRCPLCKRPNRVELPVWNEDYGDVPDYAERMGWSAEDDDFY